MNSLNEKLRVIRTQIKVYEKQASKETDQQKLYELSKKIQILSKEESELLKQLGAYDLI